MDRVDPRPIDAALAGRETGEPALDRAARVVADLRRVLLEEPSPEAAIGHLEAMVSAASDEARGSTPVLSRRRRRRPFASLPLAATLVLGAGLAWGAAGLPDRASDTAGDAVTATKARGGTEPVASPTGGPDGETHGDEVSAVARDDSLQGCEKGRAVSEVAGSNGNAPGPAQDPCVKGDEGRGNAEKASAKGKQRSAQAKAKAEAKTEGGETGAASGGGQGGPPDTAGPPESAGPPADPGSQGKGGGKP